MKYELTFFDNLTIQLVAMNIFDMSSLREAFRND
jgi:hypothetical protein